MKSTDHPSAHERSRRADARLIGLAVAMVIACSATTLVAAPTINSFTANPTSIAPGATSTLSWTTTNASSATISDGTTTLTVGTNSSIQVSPSATTTFTLTASDTGGSTATATVTVTVLSTPTIISFTASPSMITSGSNTTLSWQVSNATSVTISGVTPSSLPSAGSLTVAPASTTTYTLTASNSGATATSSLTVTVYQPATIVSFTATPQAVTAGQTATLAWATSNASMVTIDHGLGYQPANGSTPVAPTSTATYTLTATNAAGDSVTASATVTVNAFQKLQILMPGETAAPGTASGKAGSPAPQVAGRPFSIKVLAVDAKWNLMSNVTDVVRISSSDAKAALPANTALAGGTATLTVTINTTGPQTITATDASDASKTPATSAVVPMVPNKIGDLAIAAFPRGMVTTPGSVATDAYTLANVGTSSMSLTIAQTGSFFTETPSAFTLAPGETRQILLSAQPAAAGIYSGSVLPSVDGVPAAASIPIRLLVANPPAGKPDVHAASVRIDTSDNVTGGTAQFRNDGNAAATGIFVSDAAWLVPQGAAMTIDAGKTASGSFTIDRSRRPDAGTPGSQSARLKFVYLLGIGATAESSAEDLLAAPYAGSQPATGAPSVTLVDTVAPDAGPSGIPPLGAGETATFIAGLTHSSSTVADISFVSTAGSNLSDMRFYFMPTGASQAVAQTAVVSKLFANLPIDLGDVVSSVFHRSSGSGSLQFRLKPTDALSVYGRLLNKAQRGGIGTSLSVMSSTAAAAAGQDLILPALRRDSSAHTDLYIQETSGATATLQIAFLDANGADVGAARPPDSIGQFGQLELLNVVPAGAVVARITNLTGSAGKIVAEAHVMENSGEIWTVIDNSRQSSFGRSLPVMIPFAASGPGASGRTATDIVITNTLASNASGTLRVIAPVNRSRAARSSISSSPDAASSQTLSFGPRQSRVLTDVLGPWSASHVTRGYVTFTPSSGEFVITSRTYSTAPGQSSVGASIPEIAVVSGLRAGASKHVSGLEDAPAAAVNSSIGGTYRLSAGLLETAGAPVTVRVTLRFTYPLTLAYAKLPTTKQNDYILRPGELRFIDDLARSVIGPDRDSYGVLENVQVDIDVIGGSGAVVPFILSSENGSHDVFFIPMI